MTRAAALVASLLLFAAPALGVCEVVAHGALGDGVSDDTAAFRAALDACRRRGGGTVRVAPGRYVVGALELPAHTTLELEAGATLLGSLDPADYPLVETRFEGREVRGHAALISARDVENVAIVGQGAIDGRGAPWWERAEAGTLEHPRPRLVELRGVTGARVEGVTLQNAASWTLHPVYAEDVAIRGVTIRNPAEAPNTDGIVVDSSRNVRISDCSIDVGDDCIALKAGRDAEGRRVGRPTENVAISNCVLQRGHGAVVIGSETAAGVRGVVVSNAIFDGTDRGLRIKTRRGRGGTVEDVLLSNVVMRGVAQPLVVNMFYQGDGGQVPEEAVADEATPTVRGIRVSQVVARGAERAAWLRGLPERPLEDVSLRDVRLEAREGIYVKDAAGVRLRDVQVGVAEGTALRARRVTDLDVVGFAPAGAAPGPAWIELVDVRGARFEGLLAPAVPVLVRVEGEGSDAVSVRGGALGGAEQLFELDEGATPSAVRGPEPVPVD